jgi:hypothetical protein
MGCDIHTYAEVFKKGQWQYHRHGHPFDWRDYGMYGFLANVCNYSKVPFLAEPKYSVPEDLSKHVDSIYQQARNYGGYHSYSWFLLSELLAFDYEQTFDDRRWYDHPFDGGSELPPDKHNIVTFKEFLGESFFKELEHLKLLNDKNPEHVRIIFWFDN